MASVYLRKGTPFYWGKWTNAFGRVVQESLETTDREEALSRARAAEESDKAKAVGAFMVPAAKPHEGTIAAFVGTEEKPGRWLKDRQQDAPLAWPDDLSRLQFHFLEEFGGRELRWLETDDGQDAIFRWAKTLKTHTAKRDRKPLAGRSVWNIYSSVSVMLADAVELRLLKASPLSTFRADKHLPPKVDKVNGWRESAGFGLEQVVMLCTSDKLRPIRRVWNTISFLIGGPRPGEAANLRWRDWQESFRGGLGRMTIGSAWNTRAKLEKSTKTGARKHIPVHPWAAAILQDWRDRGWEEWAGRPATADDLICPRSDFRQFGNSALLDYWHADLKALGLPLQRAYETRSTFRNLLLQAGAQEFHVNLMTHPSPKQASDYYSRLEMLWPAMCETILRLKPSTVQSATVPTEKLQGAENTEESGGVYGTRRRGFTGQNSAALPLDVPGPSRTVPSLRVVPAATVPDVAGGLPDAFMDAVLEAEAKARLLSMLRASGALLVLLFVLATGACGGPPEHCRPCPGADGGEGLTVLVHLDSEDGGRTELCCR